MSSRTLRICTKVRAHEDKPGCYQNLASDELDFIKRQASAKEIRVEEVGCLGMCPKLGDWVTMQIDGYFPIKCYKGDQD